MHTKTKKAKSFYAKESKQKVFFARKIYVSVGLQQRTKRRVWFAVLCHNTVKAVVKFAVI